MWSTMDYNLNRLISILQVQFLSVKIVWFYFDQFVKVIFDSEFPTLFFTVTTKHYCQRIIEAIMEDTMTLGLPSGIYITFYFTTI